MDSQPGLDSPPLKNQAKDLLTDTIARDFKDFLDQYSSDIKPVTLRLPDFSSPDWKYQYKPEEVTDTEKSFPYFKLDSLSEKQQLNSLKQLIKLAENNDYGIIIDVGCGNSLGPLALAASQEKTIVISLDNGSGPFNTYPDKGYWDHVYESEYPYVTKYLNQLDFKNSAAFFYSLDATDSKLLKTAKESAYRVQMVAPDSSRHDTGSLIKFLISISELVSPDGELLLIGDALKIRGSTIKNYFKWEYYDRESDKVIEHPLSKKLKSLYKSVSYNDFNTHTLAKFFDIIDSRWLVTAKFLHSTPTKDNPISRMGTKPGLAVFSGKRSLI